MKTILWGTLVANGNFAQIGADKPSYKEAFGDFLARAQATGNFIVGRKTFEELATSGGGSMGEIDIVVVSQTIKEIPGVKVVSSPQEALTYLQAKGYTTTLLAGGAALRNAFLSQGLVAAPVLKEAFKKDNLFVRTYRVTPQSSLEEFERGAMTHPFFHLQRVS